MTLTDLGEILRRMYDEAPKDDKAAMVHLFGIKYADSIRDSGVTYKQLAMQAELKQSWSTEIAKGVRLAHYVRPINP